ALSGRSFSRFVRLSCAHALPLVVWQKNAQRFFWILNTLDFWGRVFGTGGMSVLAVCRLSESQEVFYFLITPLPN
ncbi:MAG: hypothetical protein UDM12_05855, partial [Prevotellamassilia sp.]|nr:hypothetical protein [Prevotellamassilia sp.]